MICSSCGTEAALGARFCSECATPLVADAQPRAADATAGAAAVPGRRVVGDVGPVAERRVVSVLFADLVVPSIRSG